MSGAGNVSGRGFTLIELLVVIAIVSVLSLVVVLTLNPAELLKQARDATRISDLATIKSAISLYLADASTTSLGVQGICYVSTAGTPPSNCGMGGGWIASSSIAANAKKVDGAGWIPVKFTDISSGAPLSNLPLDPINNATYYYSYAASTTGSVFELDAKMESAKYSANGASDVEKTDGGNTDARYETGTVAGLTY